MSAEWSTWLLLALILALMIWNITRRRKTGNTNLDAAMGVLANVDNNLKVMEERLANPQSKKKFQTAAWKIHKARLGFLSSDLTASLNESFSLAEDFNSRIDTARKNKALATLQDMPVEKLREPLTRSKDGLIAWLKVSYEDKDSSRRGCMGF